MLTKIFTSGKVLECKLEEHISKKTMSCII